VYRCPTTDHQPLDRPQTPTEVASTPVNDIPWLSDRSDTPPPPSSSPPPLSPVKSPPGGSHDEPEESHDSETWKEPKFDTGNYGNSEDSLRSSEFSDDVDAIFTQVDQSAYTSQLNASAAMGMHDSLGTLSNLSDENTTVCSN